MATGCWPLRRLRRSGRNGTSKAADSTHTGMGDGPAPSNGLAKGGADDGRTTMPWAPPPAAPAFLDVPRTPSRDVRLSLDSMAGDEYAAQPGGLPALSAHAGGGPRGQLPPVQEAPLAHSSGDEEEAERLAEVRSSLAVVQGGHPGLDSITQLCAKARAEVGHRGEPSAAARVPASLPAHNSAVQGSAS